MLLNPDYWKSVHKISDCLSLCSFNQTCAAMSYDERTSTCYMSGFPTFLNIIGERPKAFLQDSNATDISVVQCGEKGMLDQHFCKIHSCAYLLKKIGLSFNNRLKMLPKPV